MTHINVILDNGSGELDREPITDDLNTEIDPDAVKEAIERLVARVGIFYVGDIIKVVEV